MPRAVIMTILWPYAFVYNYAQRGMRGRGGGVHASRVPRRPVDLVVMDGLGGRAQDCARVRLLAGSGTPRAGRVASGVEATKFVLHVVFRVAAPCARAHCVHS